MLRLSLAGGTAVLCGMLAVAPAHANPVTVSASLYSPQLLPGTASPIDIAALSAPSQATITGSGYSVSFMVDPDQGVVHGAAGGRYAIPVAGNLGGVAEYMTGDYGSALTTDPSAAGNYFSTGLGRIAVTFTTDQIALALLWGSIDTSNAVTLLDHGAPIGTVTGADIQAAAAGFVSNGFQGPGGSAYVVLNSATPFDEAVFTSGVISFEYAGLVGSTASIPEPASIAMLGLGVFGLVGAQRRRHA